jgi:hypothetical protein
MNTKCYTYKILNQINPRYVLFFPYTRIILYREELRFIWCFSLKKKKKNQKQRGKP